MSRKYMFINLALLAMVLLIASLTASSLFPNKGDEETTAVAAAGGGGSGSLSAGLRPPQHPADTYQVIYDDDIFTDDRKPFIPPTPPPASQSPTPPATPVAPPKGLKLQGILKMGTERVALISESTVESGKALAYKQGDLIGKFGITVDLVKSDLVRLLTDQGEEMTLPLRDYSSFMASGGQPGAAGAAPPPIQQPYTPPQGRNPKRPARTVPTPSAENNPFPWLQQALEKAQKEAQKRKDSDEQEEYYDDQGDETDHEIPAFLLGLGAE